MPSKEVDNRVHATKTVIAAAEAHADSIGEALGDLLARYLHEGERMPDLALTARLVGRHLAAQSEALARAAQAHQDELSDDIFPRERRDTAFEALYEAVVDVRQAVEALQGRAALVAMGIDGPTPKEPKRLLPFARRFIHGLGVSEEPPPKSKLLDVKLDRDALARALAPITATLEQELAAVRQESREAEGTQEAKWEAIAANDEAFVGAARWLEATFRLAGNEGLAQRVRPSTKRPGRLNDAPPSNDTPPPHDAPAGTNS